MSSSKITKLQPEMLCKCGSLKAIVHNKVSSSLNTARRNPLHPPVYPIVGRCGQCFNLFENTTCTNSSCALTCRGCNLDLTSCKCIRGPGSFTAVGQQQSGYFTYRGGAPTSISHVLNIKGTRLCPDCPGGLKSLLKTAEHGADIITGKIVDWQNMRVAQYTEAEKACRQDRSYLKEGKHHWDRWAPHKKLFAGLGLDGDTGKWDQYVDYPVDPDGNIAFKGGMQGRIEGRKWQEIEGVIALPPGAPGLGWTYFDETNALEYWCTEWAVGIRSMGGQWVPYYKQDSRSKVLVYTGGEAPRITAWEIHNSMEPNSDDEWA